MKAKESDKNSSRPSSPSVPQRGPSRARTSAPSRFWTSLEEGRGTCQGPSQAVAEKGHTTTQGRGGLPHTLLSPQARKGRVLTPAGTQTQQRGCCQTSPLLLHPARTAATWRIHLLPTQAGLAYGRPSRWSCITHSHGSLSGETNGGILRTEHQECRKEHLLLSAGEQVKRTHALQNCSARPRAAKEPAAIKYKKKNQTSPKFPEGCVFIWPDAQTRCLCPDIRFRHRGREEPSWDAQTPCTGPGAPLGPQTCEAGHAPEVGGA